MSCIFCDIVSGTAPSYKVWEDDAHFAFLSIFPNTEGVTVVVPKAHHPSYVFALPDDVLCNLMRAAKTVAKMIDARLPDVGRTALVCEGFGVDHAHMKLFPMHGTKMDAWKAISSTTRTFYETYPGYIASHDSERADDEVLMKVARTIRGEASL